MNDKNKTKKRKEYDAIFAKHDDVDFIFIKEVPVHPQDRLVRATKNKDDDVIFVKKVSIHPRNRL